MWYHLLLISWVLISVNQCTHAQNQSCVADNGTCTKSGSSSSSRNKNNSKSQPKTNYSESTFPDKRSKAGGPSNSNDNSNTASKREDVGDSDGFDIYQSKIEFARKLKEGRKAVDQALRSTSNERCDWRVSPLKYLKGEYCGKHYKLFGLNRHRNDDCSPKEIKKRYRKLSLLLHPDKNPGKEATRAFSVLTDGYNCLMNRDCKDTYDAHLRTLEQQELLRRETLLRQATVYLQHACETAFFYMSWVATYIEQARASIWMQFGDVEVLDIPVGKMGMLLMLLLFRNPLLYLIGFSRAVLALNSYLADLHITFDTTHH